MTRQLSAKLAIDARNLIGECPVWDSAIQRFLWVDIAVGAIYESKLDEEGNWRESNRWSVGRPIGAAIPRKKGGFIVAAGTEILKLDETGATAPIAKIAADPSLVRFNDAKCDSRGRLWAGTTANDLITPGLGGLFRMDPDGKIEMMLKDVTVANGLGWSPDEKIFYFVDSARRTVDAFDFDAEDGTISNRRTILTIPFGNGLPDGMTVDSECCCWVAVMGAGEVHRYSPEGELLQSVVLSSPTVTSCTFGGVDHGNLLITTAGVRLPDAALAYGISAETIEKAPAAIGAGGVFVCRPGPLGFAEHQFAE